MARLPELNDQEWSIIHNVLVGADPTKTLGPFALAQRILPYLQERQQEQMAQAASQRAQEQATQAASQEEVPIDES